MRRLVTGVDGSGRSCVLEDTPVEEIKFDAMSGVALYRLFTTAQNPPPARPPGHGDLMSLGLAPGLSRWSIVEFAPNLQLPMHHTDTLDFDIVLAGSVELVVEDGVHRLTRGDCVVVSGVDHAWSTGADGCTMSIVTVGTPPPQ